jgi:hypothetical protein
MKKVIRLTESEFADMLKKLAKGKTLDMSSDKPEEIQVLRFNKEDQKSKKMSFATYDIENESFLILSDEYGEDGVVIEFDGTTFVDYDFPQYSYKPMNSLAKEIFSEIV